MRPIVGLVHHGSGPAYTSLLDSGFPEKLARYAGAVARRYPWLTDFTPVNEPLTTARFSGLYGHWYPHGRCDRDYVRALLEPAARRRARDEGDSRSVAGRSPDSDRRLRPDVRHAGDPPIRLSTKGTGGG